MTTGNLKGILAAALITTFAAGGGIETMDVKAALIAREQAKGYKINNQLTVVPK